MEKENMIEIRKKKDGITMVALVITIVVLLILAGITVNVINGDSGLIKLSKEKTATINEKFVKEEIKQLVNEYDVANDGESLEEFLKTKVPIRLDEVTRINNDQIEVKKNGYAVIVEDKYLAITLSLTPYEGIYDGQEHDTLTSVIVNPSDAKLEYSTDGINFSTTMPKIENASSVSVTVRGTKKKYKDAIKTITAKVNKAEGKLVLSATSGTITYPISESFTVSENTGNLTVSSENADIATASVNQNIVAVKPGITAGKAIITVTSAASTNYTEKTATYIATVENGTITLSTIPYAGIYDGNAHNVFSNVTVTPSDATLEYSIDGTTYSTTMPTITNTSSFTVTVKASKTGYKTQTTTETVKVNKAPGTLTLSATSGTSNYSQNITFTVSGNTGTLSVTSNNASIATANISGNTVTVKPGSAGTATITVTSAASTNYTEKTATYSATVKNMIFTGGSGVGYYADVDGNGTVDGIIFEDFKKGGSGSWGDREYTISTVSDTKNYYIIQSSYKGKFGEKPVLAPLGSGNARFYVMALNDYSSEMTYTNAKSVTSGEWSTPEINVWAAFGGELGITASNYSGHGLSDKYWATTAYSWSYYAYFANFSSCKVSFTFKTTKYAVRLARTF